MISGRVMRVVGSLSKRRAKRVLRSEEMGIEGGSSRGSVVMALKMSSTLPPCSVFGLSGGEGGLAV